MFKHKLDANVSPFVIFQWFLLSFNGGFINAGGFLATGRFVSHVTGFATLFGVDLSKNHADVAFGILSVPVFFLAGAFLAGILVERPLYHERAPHFEWVMGLSGTCLLLAAGGTEVFHLSQFGSSFALKESYLIMILLCLACGLQNGAITSSSVSSIRTTHLTGLTTDLGLGLARVFTFDLSKSDSRVEIRKNYLRIGSIVSFIFGSAVGAAVFVQYGFKGFGIAAAISFYSAWQGRSAKREKTK